MRFFSKFTLLCNLCFLASVVFWYLEVQRADHGGDGQLIRLPWLEGSLVILGYGAIIINALFLLVCLIFASLKVNLKVQAWIIGFNVLLFCGEVYFHFFFK
jgi:hypothetical protein